MAIAYFYTWTTYGTWLPGDRRGWFEPDRGVQLPNPGLELSAALRMSEAALVLDHQQRALVEKTIVDHCALRKWLLHAVNCRSNHVHVIISAADRVIETPREQFKAWCTRKLKERERLLLAGSARTVREHWWSERGWDDCVDSEEALADLIRYVRDGQ